MKKQAKIYCIIRAMVGEAGELTNGLGNKNTLLPSDMRPKDRLQTVTLTTSVGSGKEFTVYQVAQNPNVVAKRPNNVHEMAWGNQQVSIPAYHERMYERLQGVESAREYLPSNLYISYTQDGEEVIVTDHLNPDNSGAVFSMDDFDQDKLKDTKHVTEIAIKLRKTGVTADKITEFTRRMRNVMGNRLLDDAAIKNILLPSDAFLIVIDKHGNPSMSLSDFGTVLDVTSWDRDRVTELTRLSFVNIMFSLSALERVINQQE